MGRLLPNASFIFLLVAMTLSGCKIDEPADGNSCQCESPRPGGNCVSGPVDLLPFPKLDGKTCFESAHQILPRNCCSASIESVRLRNGFFDSTVIASLNVSSQLVLATEYRTDVPANKRDGSKRLDCRKECSRETSLYCESVEVSAIDGLTTAFDAVRDSLKEGNSDVSKSYLMDGFDISSDPCERSDLTFNGETLANSGKQCENRIEIEMGAAEIVSATIEIPKFIEGKYLAVSDTHSRVDFFQSAYRMRLRIDGPLDSDFGGHVNRITWSKSQYIIETERGCIKL